MCRMLGSEMHHSSMSENKSEKLGLLALGVLSDEQTYLCVSHRGVSVSSVGQHPVHKQGNPHSMEAGSLVPYNCLSY